MDDKIWIALLTAAVSIVVAILSLTTALITNRNSTKAVRSLEELKHSLHQSSESKRISDELLSKALESIKTAMQAIQIMKDEIQLILSASSDSLEPGEAAHRLVQAREHLFDVYQEHHPNLSSEESKAFHTAKNAIANIEKHIGSDGCNEVLVDTRRRLTDAQNLLRDALSTRVLERTMGIPQI